MKAPVNIHPPKNWQDFETLCLKLWGEIWNIPHEIDFNSDNSQGQNGVDIYGAVEGGLKYNGIQCKNKKLNLIDGKPNRITVSDIQTEIEKAKSFQPNLSKLIIATSLPKDQKIEEYVRKQSVENVAMGLFSIQICFWEFFERKITEFTNVYNWYIKNEDFHRVKQFAVKFDNGEDIIICHPKFQKKIKRSIFKPKVDIEEQEFDSKLNLGNVFNKYKSSNIKPKINFNELSANLGGNFSFVTHNMFTWGQICWLRLQFVNTGNDVIEDFKIELDFDGEFKRVGAENGSSFLESKFINNVKEYSNTKESLYIETKNKTLVQGDYFDSGNFYIEPNVTAENNEIIINWKLISRDFSDTGELIVRIEPKFHTVFLDQYVDNIEEEHEEVTYELFRRPGYANFWGPSYLDKESDYNFE